MNSKSLKFLKSVFRGKTPFFLILAFLAGLLWWIPGSASDHQPHLILHNQVRLIEQRIREQNDLTREMFSNVQQVTREVRRLERENHRLRQEIKYIETNQRQRSHQRRDPPDGR